MSMKIELTKGQETALEAMQELKRGEALLIEGYAGTGKTYLAGLYIAGLLNESQGAPEITGDLADYFEAIGNRYDLDIAIAAPTNKAVAVLRDKIHAMGVTDTRLHYSSIHSLLGLKMHERDDGTHAVKADNSRTQNLIEDFSLVVVDEASMIDDFLYGEIMMRAAIGGKVIFIGDPCQLPPVEPGKKASVSPVFVNVQNKVVLTEIVRQVKDNPIIALSMDIRKAIESNVKVTPAMLRDRDGGIKVFSRARAEDFMAECIISAIQQNKESRILCYMNRDVIAFNELIHKRRFPDDPRPFSEGERVIVHQQGWATITNGEGEYLYTSQELIVTGIDNNPAMHMSINAYLAELISSEGQRYRVVIPATVQDYYDKKSELFREAQKLKGTSKREYSQAIREAWRFSNEFLQLRHSYASTVHKAQGSTMDIVVVDYQSLNKIREPGAYNRALYVAITRASYFLIILI